jgi:hypothetical protein
LAVVSRDVVGDFENGGRTPRENNVIFIDENCDGEGVMLPEKRGR